MIELLIEATCLIVTEFDHSGLNVICVAVIYLRYYTCKVSTIWVFLLDFNETLRGKFKWETCKNFAWCFELIEEAATLKTVAVRPLASYYYVALVGWTRHLSFAGHQCWPTRKNLYQLYADTGCSLEDQQREIMDGEEWRVMTICVIITTWFWCFWLYIIIHCMARMKCIFIHNIHINIVYIYIYIYIYCIYTHIYNMHIYIVYIHSYIYIYIYIRISYIRISYIYIYILHYSSPLV